MSNNTLKITAEAGKTYLTFTREFDAPRELIFKAYTDKNLVKKWLSPKNYEMDIEKYDARSGGEWRYFHKDDKGNSYGFHGVFHEVSPELFIQTFEFEGLPEKGHVALETMRLEELADGRTKMTAQSQFQSVEDRDGMVASGMEGGMRECYERLDTVLAEMS